MLSSSYVVRKSVFHFIQKRYLASSSNVVGLIRTHESATTKTHELNNPNTSNEKHASVLNFFKSFGFSDAHISKLVALRPWILNADVERTLKPKLECFADYGFSGSSLHDLITADPYMLDGSVNSRLLPMLRLLQTYLGSSEKIAAAVKRFPQLLSYGGKTNMEQNVTFLLSEGVPAKSISRLITVNPRHITLRMDSMVRAFNFAKQFGFRPVDPMLVFAVNAILSKSDSTMSKKIEFVKNLLGLSEEEIKSLFKRQPSCFNYSEKKMKLVAKFFVDTVRVQSSFLPTIPAYFGHSVDKRLVPRYNVYKTLKSKKLIEKGVKFNGTLLNRNEEWFVSNYVLKYLDQVPDLMKLYRGLPQTGNITISNSRNEELVEVFGKSGAE